MNWHSNAWCDKYRREWYVLYGMVWYCIVSYLIVLSCIVLYCIVLLSRVLSCIGLYCVLCIVFGNGMVQWYGIVCVVACSVRAAALFRTLLFGSIISSVIVWSGLADLLALAPVEEEVLLQWRVRWNWTALLLLHAFAGVVGKELFLKNWRDRMHKKVPSNWSNVTPWLAWAKTVVSLQVYKCGLNC